MQIPKASQIYVMRTFLCVLIQLLQGKVVNQYYLQYISLSQTLIVFLLGEPVSYKLRSKSTNFQNLSWLHSLYGSYTQVSWFYSFCTTWNFPDQALPSSSVIKIPYVSRQHDLAMFPFPKNIFRSRK